MTITIQTKWTYELFEEAVATFEKSLSRILHIRCSHDAVTMLENISCWSRSRGHTVLTVDKDRMMVTIKKKSKKISGGYQPYGPSTPPNPPTSGSNAVKPTCTSSRGCNECGRFNSCTKSKHIENYRLRSNCIDFVTESTHSDVFNKGKHLIHTYEEFSDMFKGLSSDQEWELIKLYDRYVETLKKSWSNRYTYCSGCFKDVRRDNTCTELTTDGRLLIKCKSCGTVWYVKDAK